MNRLNYTRHQSAKALKDFKCGIPEMDCFIHRDLDEALKSHECQLFVVTNDDDVIVAMFVLSEGFFFDNNQQYVDSPAYGKPFAIFDQLSGELKMKKRYSTIEIEYLAVSQEYRNQHIGTSIIQDLTDLAKQQHTHFITVDAYCTLKYNAVPFYEKCNFQRLESQDRTYDTVRMIYQVE